MPTEKTLSDIRAVRRLEQLRAASSFDIGLQMQPDASLRTARPGLVSASAAGRRQVSSRGSVGLGLGSHGALMIDIHPGWKSQFHTSSVRVKPASLETYAAVRIVYPLDLCLGEWRIP